MERIREALCTLWLGLHLLVTHVKSFWGDCSGFFYAAVVLPPFHCNFKCWTKELTVKIKRQGARGRILQRDGKTASLPAPFEDFRKQSTVCWNRGWEFRQKSEQRMRFEEALRSSGEGLLKESNKIRESVHLVSKLLQKLLQGETQKIKKLWNNQPY